MGAVTVKPKRGKYIDPLSDLGFKRLLNPEDNPEELRSLLNALLPEDRQIAELRPLQQERIGIEADFERTIIYDLACVGTDGTKFIVEVQRLRRADFNPRLVYYASRQITASVVRGQTDFEYPDVVVVSILGYAVPDYDGPVHTVELRRDDGALWSRKLLFVFASLGNFESTEKELDSPADEWLYLLKNLETMTEAPDRYTQSWTYGQFLSNAEWANLSARDRDRYDAWWLKVTEEKAILKAMEEDVEAMVTAKVTDEVTAKVTDEVTAKVTDEVTAKVTDEVTAIKTKRTVLNAHELGLSIEQIARVADITEEEVLRILSAEPD